MPLFINVLTVFVELAVLLAGAHGKSNGMQFHRSCIPVIRGWGCGPGRKHSPSPVVCDLEGVAYPGVDPVVG